MQGSDIDTLIRALKELDLAAERINRERRNIVTRLEKTQREKNWKPPGSPPPYCTRAYSIKSKKSFKARHIAGERRPATEVTKKESSKREFEAGDRVFITNQVKSTSGHKAPRESDRYATVRYQQDCKGGKVQVHLVTDSRVKTYRLSTNVIHIGANYSCYEAGRACYVHKRIRGNSSLCHLSELANTSQLA